MLMCKSEDNFLKTVVSYSTWAPVIGTQVIRLALIQRPFWIWVSDVCSPNTVIYRAGIFLGTCLNSLERITAMKFYFLHYFTHWVISQAPDTAFHMQQNSLWLKDAVFWEVLKIQLTVEDKLPCRKANSKNVFYIFPSLSMILLSAFNCIMHSLDKSTYKDKR